MAGSLLFDGVVADLLRADGGPTMTDPLEPRLPPALAKANSLAATWSLDWALRPGIAFGPPSLFQVAIQFFRWL
jgi:hypothetical protein